MYPRRDRPPRGTAVFPSSAAPNSWSGQEQSAARRAACAPANLGRLTAGEGLRITQTGEAVRGSRLNPGEAREWIELLLGALQHIELLLVGAGIGLVLIWRTRALDRKCREEELAMREQQFRQHAATMEALRVTAIKMGYLPTASPVSAPSASSIDRNRSEPNSNASGGGSKPAPTKASQSWPGSED